MPFLDDLNVEDFESFIKLRKDFTDVMNTYISNLRYTKSRIAGDIAENLKYFLTENLSQYKVSIGVYDLSNKIQFDIEIYSDTHGIDVFPYVARNKLGNFKEIGLDKDFYGYKKANKELYGFSSIYELQNHLKELPKVS